MHHHGNCEKVYFVLRIHNNLELLLICYLFILIIRDKSYFW